MPLLKLSMLSGLLLLGICMGCFIGAANISIDEIAFFVFTNEGSTSVIWEYRIPRALLAIGVGAGLGVAGALTQGVFRNPLASPDLMGVSAGAGLAATSVVLFYPESSNEFLMIAAIFGGFVGAGAIIILAQLFSAQTVQFALIGVALSAFLASCIDFLVMTHPGEINAAMIWLTGSLWGRGWEHIPYLWGSLLVFLLIALMITWKMEAISLGDEAAVSLGIKPQQFRLFTLGIVVILSSLSISVCGTMSFVGLLAPHVARLMFRSNFRVIVLASALIGGLLVLMADLLARGIQPPLEIPAGIMTSLIGAPYFIFLLQRGKV
ncbi:FecCD family ABC transporter permease [Algicola sagamiensis]|uniref:FecCD family ABC transporter permease n=1 Tax=Algicola sagamiensis TaxID=163869 RepID=UPI0003A76859|nr:iron chelate uptake ABC transporter family permease subunit [Algicola sagamiensis]